MTCPKCNGPIALLASSGPGETRVRPCGHAVSQVTVERVTGGRA